MIEREFVETYVAVCRELELDYDEGRRLWHEIVKQIESIEARLPDAAHATEAEIREVRDNLGVPTFQALAREIRRKREQPTGRSFTGVTRDDRGHVAELAPHFFAGV
jgi:hypothetical protein